MRYETYNELGEVNVLQERGDGAVMTCSGRLFHDEQQSIKKVDWKALVLAKGTTSGQLC